MNDSHLRRLHLLDKAANHQVFTTTLRTNQDKALIAFQKRLNESDISLDSSGQEQWRGFRVLNIVDVERARGLLNESTPRLLWNVVEVTQQILGIDWSLA